MLNPLNPVQVSFDTSLLVSHAIHFTTGKEYIVLFESKVKGNVTQVGLYLLLPVIQLNQNDFVLLVQCLYSKIKPFFSLIIYFATGQDLQVGPCLCLLTDRQGLQVSMGLYFL